MFKTDVVLLILHSLQCKIQRRLPKINKELMYVCMWCADTHTYCGGPSVDNGIVAAVFCVARGGLTPTPDRD